jgi:hypothetical protein
VDFGSHAAVLEQGIVLHRALLMVDSAKPDFLVLLVAQGGLLVPDQPCNQSVATFVVMAEALRVPF